MKSHAIALTASLALVCSEACAITIDHQILALSGAPVYGEQATFRFFSECAINDSGTVCFSTDSSVPSSGYDRLCTWSNGIGQVAARQGDQIGSHPTFHYRNLGIPRISNTGQLAFICTYSTSTGDTAIVAGLPGALSVQGILRPEANPPGGYITNLRQTTDPLLSQNGQIAMLGSDASAGYYVYSGPIGAVHLEIPPSSPVQNLPAGVTMRPIFSTCFDDNGRLYTIGELFGGGFTGDRVIAVTGPQGIRAFGATGQAAPGGGTFANSARPVSANPSGKFVFAAFSVDSPQGPFRPGVWSGTYDDGLQLVAGQSTPVPGFASDFSFYQLETTAINRFGDVCFIGSARSGSDSEVPAAWLNKNGRNSLLTSAGTPIDNLPAGSIFREFFPNEGVLFNDLDQLVFLALATIPGLPGLNDALLVSQPGGKLTAIAAFGVPFEVAPGDSRIVQGIDIMTRVLTGGQTGYGSSLNNRGELAFKLNFRDGTSGVFVCEVPAAPSGIALITGYLVLARRRRR